MGIITPKATRILSLIVALILVPGSALKLIAHDDTAELARKVQSELTTAWNARIPKVINENEPLGPTFFESERLRGIRDGLSFDEIVAISQYSDDVFVQLFAFHSTVIRFPDHDLEIASRVALTNKRPALVFMADVYDLLKSWPNEPFDEALATAVEGVRIANASNAVTFAKCLPLQVLQKWFDRRSSRIPQPLQACMVNELCSRMARVEWSPPMRTTLEQYGDENGLPLLTYLLNAEASENTFRERMSRFLMQRDLQDSDLQLVVLAHSSLLRAELLKGGLPKRVESKIQEYLPAEQVPVDR